MNRCPAALMAAAAMLAAAAALAQPASSARVRAPLLPFTSEPDTGSVSFQVGDRFHGPGVLTVGWLGAKKQFVLPNGEWVVLAAVDHRSAHPRPVELTSLAFGQFDGNQLVSLMATVFNRRPSAASGLAWGDAMFCEVDTRDKLWHEVRPRLTAQACAHVGVVPLTAMSRDMAPVLWQSVQAHLAAMNADSTKPGYTLRTVLMVTDQRSNYLSIRRMDRLSATAAAGSAGPARVAWAQAYFPHAIEGFTRSLSVDELEPAVQPKVRQLTLPD